MALNEERAKYRSMRIETVSNGWIVYVSDHPLDRGYNQGVAMEQFVFTSAGAMGIWIANNVETPAWQ